MLAERSIGSDGVLELNARFRDDRDDDVRIVIFLRRALMERLLSAPHTSKVAFIDGVVFPIV